MTLLTSCGLTAPDPIAIADLGEPSACISAASDPERYATLAELAAHPKGCQFTGYEDYVSGLLAAVSSKIDDVYGRSLAVCVGARCFAAGGRRVAIDPLLRLDTIEVRACGCTPCDGTWTEIDLGDVVVGSNTDLPPWRWIEDCRGRACLSGGVRVTGAWGDAWPVHPGIKAVAITVTAKLWQSVKQNNEIIANPADGSTRFLVPDFTLNELALLPRSLVRYSGRAA